ncbi:MAG: hypothetical protein ABWY20_20310 [Mycobacterium sp.]
MPPDRWEVSDECADYAKDLTRGADLWSVSEAMQVINTPATCKRHADNHIRYLRLTPVIADDSAVVRTWSGKTIVRQSRQTVRNETSSRTSMPLEKMTRVLRQTLDDIA